jgi:hypothetical protein
MRKVLKEEPSFFLADGLLEESDWTDFFNYFSQYEADFPDEPILLIDQHDDMRKMFFTAFIIHLGIYPHSFLISYPQFIEYMTQKYLSKQT